MKRTVDCALSRSEALNNTRSRSKTNKSQAVPTCVRCIIIFLSRMTKMKGERGKTGRRQKMKTEEVTCFPNDSPVF